MSENPTSQPSSSLPTTPSIAPTSPPATSLPLLSPPTSSPVVPSKKEHDPLLTQLQRRRILELRISGASHALIADELGVSRSYVATILRQEYTAQRTLADSARDDLISLELSRLDQATLSIWPRLLKGDTRAIETYLKISERRSRLLGLDAPERQISVDLSSQLERLSPSDLITEAQRLGLPLPTLPLDNEGDIQLLPLPGESLEQEEKKED